MTQTTSSAYISIYVKLNISDESLAKLPHWEKVKRRESASRIACLVKSASVENLALGDGISISSESEYCAIKVPTLDGNEIWVFASDLGHLIEKAIGIEGVSEKLFTFSGRELAGSFLRHPFTNRDLPVHAHSTKPIPTGTGIELTSDVSRMIRELRDSGHLAAVVE
jgi:hypothetical protein